MGESEEATRDDDAEPAEGGRDEKARKTRRKKRRKKRRAKKKAEQEAEQAAETQAELPRRRPWWLLLLLIGLVELFLFGSRGRMRVCVAHQGEHDFALVDQPRTEENTRRYPTCVKRTNVGIVSKYDDVMTEATGYACQRAAILRPTDVLYQCILEKDGWEHRVETSFVPPWDPIYYRRLFWFAYD